MRRELLPLLICPSCHGEGLTLRVTGEEEPEIRQATLACDYCGCEYEVRKGIVDMILDPSPEVVKEIKAWESMRPPESGCAEDAVRSRDWLLALPMLEGKDGPRHDMQTWRRHGRAVFDLCADEDLRGRMVLELGAGRCWLSAHLARQGAKVVAIDILETGDIGLGCAEAFLEDGLFFERVLCDMNRLPFKDASFDAVVATATLHHSPEPLKLLGEIRRVLAPQGRLIAANEPLFVPWRDTPEEERKGAHEGAYTLWTWLRYLRLGGFHAYAVRVGEDASLHLKASAIARRGLPPAHELAIAAGRYSVFLALALPRSILVRFRRFKAGRPMRPLPRDRALYLGARMGWMAICERALADEEANWGPGWYAPEGGEEPFRWSSPRSRLLLPAPARSPCQLVLELATFHPSPRSDPVEVEVDVAGEGVGSVRIEEHGWERYKVPVSRPPKKKVVTVTLRVRRGYFIPGDMGLGDDRRQLGVACRGVYWEASG
jgi:SAM-dependent methyltransferase/uncharacterized protein YbaR (Trm112 family)